MQNKISISLFLIILVTSLAMMNSTQSTPEDQKTIQQLMDEAIDTKLQKYIDIRNKKCRKDIMKEASQRADSIIIARAKSMKVIQDTMQRPLIPDRPDRPDLLTPIDSSFPEPLLNTDSLTLEDTIQ